MRSASTSKRLRSWTSLISWSQSPAGTGLRWRGSEWPGQSESGDWQGGGELSAPLCGPLSRGEGETWHCDIVTSSWHDPGPGDGEGQQPPEPQEGQEKVCGSVLHSQAENNDKVVTYKVNDSIQEERTDDWPWPEGVARKTTLCRSLFPFEEENGPVGGGDISVITWSSINVTHSKPYLSALTWPHQTTGGHRAGSHDGGLQQSICEYFHRPGHCL